MKNANHLTAQPVAILLVDDDPDCRQLIRDAIREARLDNVVYEATSGEEALAMLAQAGELSSRAMPRPGLIYLDIEMPGMGGQETLKALRADARLAQTAVVMMTGVTDDEQKRQAMAHGANSYTNKPTDAAAFIQTVMESSSYWLRIHQHPRAKVAGQAA